MNKWTLFRKASRFGVIPVMLIPVVLELPGHTYGRGVSIRFYLPSLLSVRLLPESLFALLVATPEGSVSAHGQTVIAEWSPVTITTAGT